MLSANGENPTASPDSLPRACGPVALPSAGANDGSYRREKGSGPDLVGSRPLGGCAPLAGHAARNLTELFSQANAAGSAGVHLQSLAAI